MQRKAHAKRIAAIALARKLLSTPSVTDETARAVMYQAYQAQADLMWPLRAFGRAVGADADGAGASALGAQRGAPARRGVRRCSSSAR